MRASSLPLRRLLVALLVSLLVIALDQLTKAYALAHWQDESWALLERIGFELGVIFNDGAAFGLYLGETFPFLGLGLLVVVGLGVWLARRRAMRFRLVSSVAVGLMCGGIIGNLIDRMRYEGQVLDFIHIGDWFPVFNLADASLFVGAVLILLFSVRSER